MTSHFTRYTQKELYKRSDKIMKVVKIVADTHLSIAKGSAIFGGVVGIGFGAYAPFNDNYQGKTFVGSSLQMPYRCLIQGTATAIEFPYIALQMPFRVTSFLLLSPAILYYANNMSKNQYG